METMYNFQNKMKQVLSQIPNKYLSYNEDEQWLVESFFDYIEFYAVKHGMKNTYIALHLARGLHNGSYRKLTFEKEGVSYKLPYLIHPLSVTRMLVDLPLTSMSDSQRDILFAAALCHDFIEDIPFKRKGKEMYENLFLDQQVYEIVKLVSKRKDFTQQEEIEHFHQIESNEYALLVKLSDRGNNVEDLYNMKVSKVNEYVDETNRFFIPMIDYALSHYTNHLQAFGILKDKIMSLTDVAQILVTRYGLEESMMRDELEILRNENEMLKRKWKSLWKVSD